MRSKATWILILVLVVVIGGAGVLYKTLGSRYTPDQLTVEATPAPTAAPDGEAATSEASRTGLAGSAGLYRLRCGRQRRASVGLPGQTAGVEFLGQLVRSLQERDAGIPAEI